MFLNMAKQFWIFCVDKFLRQAIKQETETFNWEQKRKFLGQKGEDVLMLEFGAFTSSYTIDYVILKRIESIENEKWEISVTLKLKEKFKERKELSDYLYSFPRIKYFDRYAHRHFIFKYYRMNELEYEAVVKDDIFVSRSMLGTAINSMHIDHRKAFVKALVNKYPEVVIGKLPFDTIAKELISYIKTSIIVPAKYLQQGTMVLSTITQDDILTQVGFQNEKNTNIVNSIQPQVRLIGQYLTIAEQLETLMTTSIKTDKKNLDIGLLSDATNELSYLDVQKERRFERLFTNKFLPIEL